MYTQQMADDFAKRREADIKKIEEFRKQRIRQQELDEQLPLVPVVLLPINPQLEARIKALEEEVKILKEQMQNIDILENRMAVVFSKLLTFDAEGTERSCRQPHWPGGASGVTIGHGYDLKCRTDKQKVQSDLRGAGFPESSITVFSEIAELELEGEAAHQKVEELKKKNLPDLTLEQQQKLFVLTLPSYIKTVKDICTNRESKEAKEYGYVKNWEALDPRIKEVLVDLCYNGHYTIASRKEIQPSVINNDFKKFKELLSTEALWRKLKKEGGIFKHKYQLVAEGRYKSRVAFLNRTNVILAAPRPSS
jgi:hypothetical protein